MAQEEEKAAQKLMRQRRVKISKWNGRPKRQSPIVVDDGIAEVIFCNLRLGNVYWGEDGMGNKGQLFIFACCGL
jgi:hypothetical protein